MTGDVLAVLSIVAGLAVGLVVAVSRRPAAQPAGKGKQGQATRPARAKRKVKPPTAAQRAGGVAASLVVSLLIVGAALAGAAYLGLDVQRLRDDPGSLWDVTSLDTGR